MMKQDEITKQISKPRSLRSVFGRFKRRGQGEEEIGILLPLVVFFGYFLDEARK